MLRRHSYWYIYVGYNIISSTESQKGIIELQRCSVENQKGTIAVQSLWR